MSNYFHSGVTRHMAEKLVTEQLTGNIGCPTGEIPEIKLSNIAAIERALNDHACRAAGICGNDPSQIYRMIWYKSDGWEHGGSAMSWRERAEELEAELQMKNALLDRVKNHLDSYMDAFLDGYPGSNSLAKNAEKLLTDIEHL